MSPNGIDALRQQRAQSRRPKPPSRHPVDKDKKTEPEQEVHADAPPQVQAPTESKLDTTPNIGAHVDQGPGEPPAVEVVEQTAVVEPPVVEVVDARATEKPQVQGTEGPRPPRKDRNPARPKAASDSETLAPVIGLRGEDERREVAVIALSWAATARKLAEREQHLREAVQAAVKAGTPPELIIAALVEAEARAGFQLPSQVRDLIEARRKAR